jgi:hypothetical protein
MKKSFLQLSIYISILLLFSVQSLLAEKPISTKSNTSYIKYVQTCIDNLMLNGTDRYGEIHAPILVSILDIETLTCPSNPKKLDEYFRVTRRERRNPAGSNLLTDQPTLKTMYFLSEITNDNRYSEFADNYTNYVQKKLVDKNGFFWWGWHRHYDVYKDIMDGHNGNHHEIHSINCINWEQLWTVNHKAVEKEISAIWDLHVINKKTGEINRHGDGKTGCDFSMSAGAFIEAFAFMYTKTQNIDWLNKANLLADYYWNRRNKETGLFPERPNAGADRFDGSCFVTSITGLYCHSLLKAYELTGVNKFKDQAIVYLKAYSKYGYDQTLGKYWGALQLDGSPIPGPRVYTDNLDSSEGYAAAQPRGHLDIWEPYVAGYQFAVYTAQAYIYAFQITKDPEFLTVAKRFATWIQKTPPGTVETENAWYKNYSNNKGMMGTYAGKYGRTISFYLHLYILTSDQQYFNEAQQFADMAIKKLYKNGIFKGHPAKPYYEAMDGVGYLLYSLLQLNEVVKNQESVLTKKKIISGLNQIEIPLDNW